MTESAEIRRAVEQFDEYIRGETLAVSIVLGPLNGVSPSKSRLATTALTVVRAHCK